MEELRGNKKLVHARKEGTVWAVQDRRSSKSTT